MEPSLGDRPVSLQRSRVERLESWAHRAESDRPPSKTRVDALKQADPGNEKPIPVDLITASSSGLDPHISPAAAEYQVSRVAKARGLQEESVRDLVTKHTELRTFGLLGEERVNVVTLNLDLDKAKP